MPDELRIEVAEFTDIDHWYWRLTDANGAHKADHHVALDKSEPQYEAFVDLDHYLHRNADPDRRLQHEAEILEWLGRWIGQHVFGPMGEEIVAAGTPRTVRVILPREAAGILFQPLELAYVGDRPLAQHDVSLVFEIAGQVVRPKRPIGDRLRMLAVFSLPTGAMALGLRRERYTLSQLIRRIAQTTGKAIELQVLQYGTTRQRLKEALEDGDGWDILHFSGHGLPAGLVLERADGTRDLITSNDVMGLLRPARQRVKLVVLSACESAAATVEETLRWLHIYEPVSAAIEAGADPDEPSQPMPAMAQATMEALDCAVLAMRYPVGDEFAIALATNLYEGLLGQRRRLPEALQLALRKALGDEPRPGVSPISVATPALFGRRAVALDLRPPDETQRSVVAPTVSLARFPDEAERFVGRVGPMARASAAIAAESGKTGVVFHGMAGAGKTACAVELAYRYEKGRFGDGFVFYEAPKEDDNIATALFDFAHEMEVQLGGGFKMIHVVDREDELLAFLPRLTEMLEQHAILIVLDNLESLLTESGAWRDHRWGPVIAALLAHRGFSRTMLTSRRLPLDVVGDDRVLIEPIHALSLSESVILAQQLPNLSRLLRGDGSTGLERGRQLVTRTLAMVQGHPKLIDLADRLAADPDTLERQLDRAAQAWAKGSEQLETFFRAGESPFDPEDYLRVLADWTEGITLALPPFSRLMFHFLCCLEDSDRQSGVIGPVWPGFWPRLGLPGDVSGIAATMEPLVQAGLVGAAEDTAAGGQPTTVYRLHPGVAQAGRAHAGEAFRAVVDEELAGFWSSAFQLFVADETSGTGGLVIHAGRSAAPYLLRRRRWEVAAALLEQVVVRDSSPDTLAMALPLMRHMAGATAGTEGGLQHAGLVASVLSESGRWEEAEALLREVIAGAAGRDDFRTASALSGELLNLLRDRGRLEEALALVDEMKEYTRRAGLGPWTQLGDEAQRLQILAAMGRHEEVLEAVEGLRERMAQLPQQSDQEEAAEPWNVRELILNVGCRAALGLERWEVVLALNAEIAASEQARGAPPLKVAGTAFNDYGPLLRLERYDDARAMLYRCRYIFEQERAVVNLGRVFGALADVEARRDNLGQSITFEEAALRYSYVAGLPEDCSISHFSLAEYLMRSGREPGLALAHRLAAAIMAYQSSSGILPVTLQAIVRDFAAFAGEPPLPGSFAELCSLVEQVEGVRFRELFEGLPRRAASGDEALALIISVARAS